MPFAALSTSDARAQQTVRTERTYKCECHVQSLRAPRAGPTEVPFARGAAERFDTSSAEAAAGLQQRGHPRRLSRVPVPPTVRAISDRGASNNLDTIRCDESNALTRMSAGESGSPPPCRAQRSRSESRLPVQEVRSHQRR